jgi:predicted nucleotidyltransferase
MEIKLTILKPFFEGPEKAFSVRQLSRILRRNHVTISKHLKKFVKEGFLTQKKQGIYLFYQINSNKKTLNLKFYYNLEKLRISNIVEDLEKFYDFPVIVLFGSYASATDDSSSDIDIGVISNINKEFDAKKYEKLINRKISIHRFDKSSWRNIKKSNPDLVNSICNGIILSGSLEVLK